MIAIFSEIARRSFYSDSSLKTLILSMNLFILSGSTSFFHWPSFLKWEPIIKPEACLYSCTLSTVTPEPTRTGMFTAAWTSVDKTLYKSSSFSEMSVSHETACEQANSKVLRFKATSCLLMRLNQGPSLLKNFGEDKLCVMCRCCEALEANYENDIFWKSWPKYPPGYACGVLAVA